MAVQRGHKDLYWFRQYANMLYIQFVLLVLLAMVCCRGLQNRAREKFSSHVYEPSMASGWREMKVERERKSAHLERRKQLIAPRRRPGSPFYVPRGGCK
jgi:hypothetical protein